MNKFFTAFILALIVHAPSLVYAQDEINERPMYTKTSGIFMDFDRQSFLLKRDNMESITAAILKAKERLQEKTEFYILYKREDNRFFEVESLSQVFSDPNAPGSRINYLQWILVQDFTPQKPSMPHTILHLSYSLKYGANLLINCKKMDWALLTADDLEAEIKRTIHKRINYINLLTIIITVAIYYFTVRMIIHLLPIVRFKDKATETILDAFMRILIGLPLLLAIYYLLFGFRFFIAWLWSSKSYFLWGDMIEGYHSALSFNSNLLWGVVVGLLVSIAGNLIVARLSKKRDKVFSESIIDS